MANWREYQREVRDFFRSLGCSAEMDLTVQGVRTESDIDVWVEFQQFGLCQKWIIECKLWNSAVKKGQVQTLRTIVDDVGADKGILVSAKGFQKGAIECAQMTNIALVTDKELFRNAQQVLQEVIEKRIRTRIKAVHESLRKLVVEVRSERTKMGWSSTSKCPAPFEGMDLMAAIGRASMVEAELDRGITKGNYGMLFLLLDLDDLEKVKRPVASDFMDFAKQALEFLDFLENWSQRVPPVQIEPDSMSGVPEQSQDLL